MEREWRRGDPRHCPVEETAAAGSETQASLRLGWYPGKVGPVLILEEPEEAQEGKGAGSSFPLIACPPIYSNSQAFLST